MDKINEGAASPFILNATIHKDGQVAQVGLIDQFYSNVPGELLNLTNDCDVVNGWTTFDMTMELSPAIAALIGDGVSLEYEVNSFLKEECEQELEFED